MNHVWKRRMAVLISDFHSHHQDLTWHQAQKLLVAGRRLFYSTTTHITGQQGLGGGGKGRWAGDQMMPAEGG